MATTPSFYARVRVRMGATTAQVLAPFTDTLPTLTQQHRGTVNILDGDGSGRPKGLYLWTGTAWGFGVPLVDVADAIGNAFTLNVFYALDAAYTSPYTQKLWQNGVAHSPQPVPAKVSSVWGSLEKQYADAGGGATGTVSSVNNIGPDAQGNVQLEQLMMYSVSLPAEGLPQGETVYFQEIIDTLTSTKSVISSQNIPSEDAVFKVQVNGADVGVLAFKADGSTEATILPNLTPGSVLALVSPQNAVPSAGFFSFNFEFKRA